MDSVEEIKQKLDIVQVVGEYVKLKRTGINWRGVCPFHNEKTPSFFVNEERQIFHCFGCNTGGDMFTFIEKIENIDFSEALKILATKAGVQLEQFDARTNSLKNRVLEINRLAAELWQSNLQKSNGARAVEYLKKRKVAEPMVSEFKLGYSEDSWDATMKYLLSKGYTETEIFQAGLTVKKEGGSNYYDRFRDRLVFPIQDLHGNVIGFSARALDPDISAKYINTPETMIYHKGNVLYGIDKAKASIREKNYVVLVEGNMDVITCHEFGYKNCVACSGTALTTDQIKILKRYTNNVALCLDQDEAGQTATSRSIDLLLELEMNIKIVHLKSGKDPDECLRNNSKDWEESLGGAKHIMQFYFDRYLTQDNLNNILKKKEAVKSVIAQVLKLKDKIEQDHWTKKLATAADVSESVLQESLPRRDKSVAFQKKTTAPDKVEKSIEDETLERIFSIVANYPDLLSEILGLISVEIISNEKLASFYKNLLMYYNANEEKSSSRLIAWLDKEDKNLDNDYLNLVLVSIDKYYSGFPKDQLNTELINLTKFFKRNYLERELRKKEKQFALAESAKNDTEINQIILDMQTLRNELIKLKN